MSVRIKSLKIYNFKNIEFGEIKFPKEYKNYLGADLLAIYGENGSGKSTLIEVFNILRDTWCGKTTFRALSKNTENTVFEVLLSVDEVNYLYSVKYNTSIINEKIYIIEKRTNSLLVDSKRIFKDTHKLNNNVHQLVNNIKKYANNIYISKKRNSIINIGNLEFRLFEQNYYEEVEIDILLDLLLSVSNVLKALNVNLIIKEDSHRSEDILTQREQLVHYITLQTETNGVIIDLKDETVGKKKLVSIIFNLMNAFVSCDHFVIIDEIDSSINEFLLGELLRVLKDNAKGQILLTAHNLRMLEVLENDNLMFTTLNRSNKFIKLKNVRKGMNIRDFYLRSIIIGGQEEDLVSDIDRMSIRLAFEEFEEIYESNIGYC